MNKLSVPFFLFLFLVSTLVGQPAGQRLTLEDIFIEDAYSPPAYHVGPWIEGGAAFLVIPDPGEGVVVLRHDVVTGEESVFLDVSSLRIADNGQPIPVETQGDLPDERSFVFSPDRRWVVIAGDERRIWRRSREARYFLHDRQMGTTHRLAAGQQPQSNARFSPDSQMLAYVMGNNLYVYDLVKARTRQLTRDGSGDVINGQADWLYEEEFSVTRAFEWSPDSRSILYLRFDQGHLPSYPLVNEMPQYPELTLVRYPKVAERNSLVQVGVVDVRRGRTRWLGTGSGTDIYIPRLYWTGAAGEAAFYRLDRRQQRLQLLFADAKTGRSWTVATQTDTTWLDVTDDLHFLGDGSRFLWTTEAAGYRHIHLVSSDGTMDKALTSGEWEVGEILDVDERSGVVYFTANRDGLSEQHVYKVGIDGSGLERLTEPGGWHTFDFAPGYIHFIHEQSTADSPTRSCLHHVEGGCIRDLGQLARLNLADMDAPVWEFFNLPTTDGTELNAMMLKPKDFNPGSRYPTVIYTYGGPASQVVADRWGSTRGLWHVYLAQEGYVVLTVDNRGTGGRGETFRNLAYGDIGKWALHDQIEVARWIGRQSWSDPERIAIWGWSGGGYLTNLCLTAGTDHFKCGISVAPVTDFRLYDTAWTERYMGLLPENQAGYASADVLSYVDRYQGGLLLVHGTGDDNVHPQHSWQFIQKLVERDMPFDLMMYPGKNHSLPGVQYHLYSKMTAFLKYNL